MTDWIFRAWHKRDKRMFNVSKIDFVNKTVTEIGANSATVDCRYVLDEINHPFESVIIMQSTGLEDAYGTNIHDGDVLDFTVFNAWGNDTQYTGVVRFESGGWKIWNKEQYEFYGDNGAFDLFWVHQQDDEIEVLGNIHDNPELLEENNE